MRIRSIDFFKAAFILIYILTICILSSIINQGAITLFTEYKVILKSLFFDALS